MYMTAKRCFEENLQLTGGAQADSVSYNLYNGLTNLTEAVESDFRQLNQKLDLILAALQRRQ